MIFFSIWFGFSYLLIPWIIRGHMILGQVYPRTKVLARLLMAPTLHVGLCGHLCSFCSLAVPRCPLKLKHLDFFTQSSKAVGDGESLHPSETALLVHNAQ